VSFLFAVIRKRGPAWDTSKLMRAQDYWQEHAEFMEVLTARSVIVLGGPLGDTQDSLNHHVLLVIQAENAQAVDTILAQDIWTEKGLLETQSVEPWTILLRAERLP
jgi:uncharacterized protein YciI